MKKLITRFAILVLLCPISCSDEGEAQPALLQLKSWATESHSFSPAYPNAATFNAELDDVISFYDNGVVVYDNGGTEGPDDPEFLFGSWSMNPAGTEISLTMGTQTTPTVRQVVTSDNNNLSLKSSFVEGGTTYEVTRKHKAVNKVILETAGWCSLQFRGDSYSVYDDNQGSCNGDKTNEMIQWTDAGQILFGVDMATGSGSVFLNIPLDSQWTSVGSITSMVQIQPNGDIKLTNVPMESSSFPGTSSLSGLCKCVSGSY